MSKKVAVAMSGGVDSSVAAALMVDKYGKENVFGVTMRLFCYSEVPGGESKEPSEKSCCSLEAVADAKNVCDQLGIAHYAISFEKEFERDVIDNFIEEYEKGHTPNPCIRCNQFVKYEHLLKKAKGLGADVLVTGHYARIKKNGETYQLLRGKDSKKDQSYFLYNLTQNQLSQIEFPIGELEKSETRNLAEKYQLKTAHKTESQDICFVPSTVEDFLKGRADYKSGNIVDSNGKVLGKHAGLAFYTIGQRKGLGGGFNEPMFVIGLDSQKNELVIGPEKELYNDKIYLSEVHFIAEVPVFPLGCSAKIRYQTQEAKCILTVISDGFEVIFNEPQKAITPGQSIVFYNKETVIGGGVITKLETA